MGIIETSLRNLGVQAASQGTSSGKNWYDTQGEWLASFSPVDGNEIGKVQVSDKHAYDSVVKSALKAATFWRDVPAPKRGEVIRQIGNALREKKNDLGNLVSYEMGKSLQEGLGEVQEMIDICDFAVGLSRQLYGFTMSSERPEHQMYEQWHPLGIVGILSAFNFPVAVWSWNAMIAWVCGNVCIWKPSERTPLSALACQQIVADVFDRNGLPEGISCLVTGDYRIGEWISNDERIPLVSATGSTKMGRSVGQTVAARLGKAILELGGNNAVIISEKADLDLAIRAALFGAVGTAGQRCTTTRRLIVHDSLFEEVAQRLKNAYGKLSIGNPLDPHNHMGPLIDKEAVEKYLEAVRKVKAEGGRTIADAALLEGEGFESGCYVKPCIFEVKEDSKMAQHETFAPLLYMIRYRNIEDAIRIQNNVPQGLSSAIMTTDLREAGAFLSAAGSDCGIANVNIGTSGAEIGGAFGGEKETGGGRESGSDAWKAYMRRQTNTINYGRELPLAQGIKFDI
ncbi:aldehyde dehydrogenase family protein [Negadavirga shengliensis]|uniref:aldehyde dehydrogenase (NAD(+)) n=1 Tax=Negadavirga shengliensis TaxID=1389218 RepID=A0ABV9SVC4_9BACT